MKVEAAVYKKLAENQARCELCPQNCRIGPGQSGICRVRVNLGGTLFAANYGEVSSLALDPMEKKPLYHFHPGKNVLSVGTAGCNLACGFCQNYRIAHEDPPTRFAAPRELLEMARECEPQGSVGVAYTYSEPLMWYEYLRDAMPVIKDGGFLNVLVTNGYINPEPLRRILPAIDAMNIDLKSFSEQYYRANCHGRLEPVKKIIELCAAHTHVELTTLLVTGLNDRPDEIEALARWAGTLDPSIPLHLSAYYPAYKFNLPPTPHATMKRAWEAARAFLPNVYVGNMPGFDNSSYCHHCGALLVNRQGRRVTVEQLDETRCARCGNQVPFTI